MTLATETAMIQTSTTDAPFDLTAELYVRMVELDLIPRDRRVYLMGGRLYEKMAKKNAHGYVGAALDRAINRRLPDEWCLWPESTIVLDSWNAPLPDFAIIRGANPLDYGSPDRYPGPSDVGVLIEIALSSLRVNLSTTLELYARALIPVYWVLDVMGRRIVAHSEPKVVEGRGTYGRVEIIEAGGVVPLVLDGREVARIPFEELLR